MDVSLSTSKAFHVFVLLLLLSGNAEMSLLANLRCQFLSPCDLVDTLNPVIDSMDAQMSRLSQFEKNSLLRIYELTERVEILEELLGLPYWPNSIKPTKPPPPPPTDDPESPLASYSVNDGIYAHGTGSRRSRNRVRDEPLLVRIADIEKWKDDVQHEVIKGLTTNMEEILLQLRQFDSVPRQLEVHNARHAAANSKILNLQGELTAVKTRIENVEDNDAVEEEQFMQMIRLQSDINADVEDLRKNVSIIDDSLGTLGELEKRQSSFEQTFRSEILQQSVVFERRWKGFHDDLHVLIDDVVRLEDQQVAFEEETRQHIADGTCNGNNATQEEISKLKKAFQDEVTKDLPSKKDIVSLWESIDNITNKLETVETQIKEEFEEELISFRNFANASTLPTRIQLERIESVLKWREKQIRVNSINIEDLSAQLQDVYSTVKNISAEVTELQLREANSNISAKQLYSSLTNEIEDFEKTFYDTAERWNGGESERMSGDDAVAEFLVLQKPPSSCNFTVPKADSHLYTSLDDRPLDHSLPGSSVTIPSGHMITFRCHDVGRFQFTGDTNWICDNGDWQRDGQYPHCRELLTEDKVRGNQMSNPRKLIPSIKVIPVSPNESIGITASGELLMLPGSDLVLSCIFPKSYGFPQWSRTTHSKSFLPGRWFSNRHAPNGYQGDYRYQISLFNLQEHHTGTYTCDAGLGRSHAIRLNVKDVRCPIPSLEDNIMITATAENKMHSRLDFRCKNPTANLQWSASSSISNGTSQVYCLPSGQWSMDFPKCSEQAPIVI